MIKNIEPKKTEISLYITLFAASIGIWYYLLNYIIQASTEHPADLNLAPLAFCHALCFLCIVFCFVVLVNESAQFIQMEPSPRRTRMSKNCPTALFMLWGPMLLVSLISLALAQVIPDKQDGNVLVTISYFLGVALSVLCFFWIFNFKRRDIRRIDLVYYCLIFPYTLLYIALISLLAGGVDFKTDKQFYGPAETVRLSVRPKGFMFLPQIIEVDYAGDTLCNPVDHTYAIDLRKYPTYPSSNIRVIYTAQLPPLSSTVFFTLFRARE